MDHDTWLEKPYIEAGDESAVYEQCEEAATRALRDWGARHINVLRDLLEDANAEIDAAWVAAGGETGQSEFAELSMTIDTLKILIEQGDYLEKKG